MLFLTNNYLTGPSCKFGICYCLVLCGAAAHSAHLVLHGLGPDLFYTRLFVCLFRCCCYMSTNTSCSNEGNKNIRKGQKKRKEKTRKEKKRKEKKRKEKKRKEKKTYEM